MAYYASISRYLKDTNDRETKLVRLDQIIDTLYDTALKIAAGEDISEYSYDDGQVKIRNVYKDSATIRAAIGEYEKIRDMMQNKLNSQKTGRIHRLIDSKNLNRGC
jgi:hypothetical protein